MSGRRDRKNKKKGKKNCWVWQMIKRKKYIVKMGWKKNWMYEYNNPNYKRKYREKRLSM